MNFKIFGVILLLLLVGCNEQGKPSRFQSTADAEEASSESSQKPERYFQERYQKIVTGQATVSDVREALTDRNVAALTNTLHGLFAMRYHRGVLYLLEALWKGQTDNYPELAWDQLNKTPTRLALASTLNRIYIGHTDEYIDFIRAHKDETHEFHLAQVAIGLGLHGDPADVDYLKDLASGDNVYIVQTSLTGLSLMNNPRARDALIEIEQQFQDDPRARLAAELLRKAYNWPDETTG